MKPARMHLTYEEVIILIEATDDYIANLKVRHLAGDPSADGDKLAAAKKLRARLHDERRHRK